MLNYHHHDETLKNVVITLLNTDTRIRVFLMMNDTGNYIPEEYDIMGYVRKTSSGGYPLLVNNRRSLGGGIFPYNVGKIIDTKTKKVLFINPSFKMGEFNLTHDDNNYSVSHNDTIIAIFKEQEKAIKFISFMKGERNSK